MPTLFLGNHIGNGHNIKIQRTAPQIPDFALDFCPPLILAFIKKGAATAAPTHINVQPRL